MQLIGGGAHGPQAAAAIRHVAAQNGVWSLGNFGGVPPKSAMTLQQVDQSTDSADQQSESEPLQIVKIDIPDYRFVFNSCGVGMVCCLFFLHKSDWRSLTLFIKFFRLLHPWVEHSSIATNSSVSSRIIRNKNFALLRYSI